MAIPEGFFKDDGVPNPIEAAQARSAEIRDAAPTGSGPVLPVEAGIPGIEVEPVGEPTRPVGDGEYVSGPAAMQEAMAAAAAAVGSPDVELPEANLGYDPTQEQTLHLAEEGHRKLKCPKCDTVQSATNKTCTNCGHDLTEARKAKFANMSGGEQSDLNLDQGLVECPNCGDKYPVAKEKEGDGKCPNCKHLLRGGKHLSQMSASIYEHLELSEGDGEESGDGLVWKAVCKTGTLALSPGPGQIDVEKPLELSEDMFDELIASVDEQAFPHITVPLSHDNGILENTGFVRKLEKRDAPDGEKYLMAGIEFTEPEIKQKVMNGSIADTSVGVKFNYRNKRTGKLYPSALEHVALTQIPWVDGLPAFGAELSQPYDREQIDSEEQSYAGVFMSAPASTPEKPKPKQSAPKEVAARRRRNLTARRRDILPRRKNVDRVPPTMDRTKRTTKTRKPAAKSGERTVEQLLAAQQARTERTERDLSLAQREAAEAKAEAREANKNLALSAVSTKVKELQDAGHLPAVVQRYEQIALASVESKFGDGDGMSLSLSVTPSEGGDPVETEMGPVEVAEYLLSAITPISPLAQEFLAQAGEGIALAAPKDDETPSQKADRIERSAHPERFNDDGSRKDEVTA